jgi:hypothetical protein
MPKDAPQTESARSTNPVRPIGAPSFERRRDITARPLSQGDGGVGSQYAEREGLFEVELHNAMTCAWWT